MEVFLENLTRIFLHTTWLEWFSVGCSVLQVLLSKNNKVSNYFFGILGITSGMYVLFGAKLYAEMALNMYYLVMSIYGWWYWTTNVQAKEQPITSCTPKEWIKVIGIALLGFVFFFVVLKNIPSTLLTPSDVPAWDAWVSSTAWAGMWLLAKRKVENWILLNISNLFAVPLLLHKHLYLFAVLTTFLFIVAIFGYFKWRRIMKKQTIQS